MPISSPVRAGSARRRRRGCSRGRCCARSARERRALRRVPGLRRRGGQRGHHRDRRRLQPADRGHPHAARERQVRAGARPLQGLHHRRGAPAHRATPSTRCSRRWRSRRRTSSSCWPPPTRASIPATVLSRVQRFDFRPIAPDAAGGDARAASSTKEKIAFEPAALPAIVRARRGLAARRALAARHRHRLRQRPARGRDDRGAARHHRARRGARLRAARCVGHDTDAGAGGDRPRRARGRGSPARSRATSIELLRRALVLKAAPAAKLADVAARRGQRAARARRGGLARRAPLRAARVPRRRRG